MNYCDDNNQWEGNWRMLVWALKLATNASESRYLKELGVDKKIYSMQEETVLREIYSNIQFPIFSRISRKNIKSIVEFCTIIL